MTRMTASQLRDDLATAINRVAFAGERIVLRRNKKDVAALVPVEDLALLEELEDQQDYDDAEKALAEMEARGEKPIPWEEVARDLGIRLPRPTTSRARARNRNRVRNRTRPR